MESIFNYKEYRKFLRDWVYSQPKRGRGIYKQWSEFLRIEPSVLSQILSGKRTLNMDQGYELQKNIGLSALEAEYFSVLIQLELANTSKLREHLKEKLKTLQKESLNLSKRLEKEKILSDEEKSIFYSSWIFSAIRIATSISNYQTVDSISEKLGITREKTINILNFLVSSGLIINELGIYKVGPQRTHLEKTSPHIIKHHANWRMKSIQHSENLLDEEIMFTGPLSISKKDFKILREEIVKLISKVSETVKETNPEDIAYFGIDLFWV